MKVPCLSLLTLASATILFVGCTKEKSKDIIVNPIDSSSTAFIPAVTTLINTPPSDVEIPTATVTVRWQGTRDVFGIRYKLDDEEWTDLTTQNEITVSDLDEGLHTVTVQAQHKNGSLELQPPTFSFRVNAIQGQSVMFLKRKKKITRNTDFQYFVKAEEVDSLMGFAGVVQYNPSWLRINSISAGNLKKHPAIDVQHYTSIDNVNGKIRLNLAILGGSPVKGLSGTDTLFVFNCTALSAVGETSVTFLRDSTHFRNINNLTIPIRSYVDGKVVIR